MTKRQIEALAAAIVIARESLAVAGHVDPLIEMALEKVAHEIALVCLRNNSAFSVSRFMAAAGVTP